MANKLTASILLKLEDQLSGGLMKLQRRLEALQAVFQKLSMAGLDDGVVQMNRATTQAQRLAREVGHIGQSADSTGAKLKRMAQQTSGTISVSAAGIARMQGQMGQMLALAGAGGMKLLGSGGGNGGMWTPEAMQAIRGATSRPSWSYRLGAGAAGAWHGAKQLGEQVGPIGAAAGGYAMFKSISQYAGYENGLRHMAITQKMSGPAVEAEVARLAKNFNADALGSGQRSTAIAHAANFLLTTGMSMETVDELMPIHARAATAYNVSSDSMGQAVFALHDSFKIGHEDMPGALSAMANAAKEGHFNVESFSRFLPEIGGSMSLLGMTGRKSADIAFAALETVVKNSADPSTAATNFNDMLRYMTQPIAVRSFKHAGIDLPAVMRNAEKQGINPLYAFLGKLEQMVKGKSDVDAAFTLGTVLHNQQAGVSALSLVKHKDSFLSLVDRLHGADKTTLDADFVTAFRAPKVQLEIMGELLDQISRRIGEGFVPILQALNIGLLGVLNALKWLDERVPGSVNVILLVVGGLVALAAVAVTLGIVVPALVAGFALLASPIGLVILALAALALSWDTIVWAMKPTVEAIALVWHDLASGIKDAIVAAADAILGIWRNLLTGMQTMIADVWNAIADSVAGRALGLTKMDDPRAAPGSGDLPDHAGRSDYGNLSVLPGAQQKVLVEIKVPEGWQQYGVMGNPMGDAAGPQIVTVMPPAPNRGATLGRD